MRDHKKLNAIVVAGDRGKSHSVAGKNKAFLDVGGLPVVTRVVMALDKSNSVSEIYVIGPGEDLREALTSERSGARIDKPVHIIEQRQSLYENMWNAYLETLPSYRRGESVETIEKGPEADTVALGVAADMPLLSGAEVDEFVSKCDMDRYDYVLGVTQEEDLRHYYPDGGRPGIHLAYLHFREGNLRQNNMHMVRPFKILNRYYIQTMYDLRYQKEFGNMARLAWEILNKEEGGWGTLGNYLLMQLSLLFARLRLGFMRDFVRRRTHVDSVVECISKLLKTRFAIAYTSFGGATLDIDNEHEYEVIKQRFSEWMNHQEEKARKLSLGVGSH